MEMAAEESNFVLDLSQPNKDKALDKEKDRMCPSTVEQETKELSSKSVEHKKCMEVNDEISNTIQYIKVPIFNKLIPNGVRKKKAKDDRQEESKKKTSQRSRKKVIVKKRLSLVDGKKGRVFPCLKCDHKFDLASDLKSHSVEHQDQTRHKCEVCGRCFNRAMCLKIHMHSHTKQHKCALCVNTYNSKLDLRRHMRVHKRTVECNECDAKFHTMEQLAKHARKHNMEGHSTKSGSDDQSSNYSTGKLASSLDQFPVEFSEDGNDVLSEDITNDNSIGSKDNAKSDNNVCTRREELSHSTQVAIINKMYKGRSIDDICKIYNITPALVNEVWEDRDKFDRPKKVGVKTAKYMNSILDSKILEWLSEQRENNVTVTGKMIQATAESVANEFGFVSFNGNKKWLERFKKKHNILLKSTRVQRDYSNTSEFKFKNQFFKETWYDARLGLPDENIYTADEVGLFFNVSKGRTKKITGKKFIQGHVKDRLSIFMCTNATGTDKKKLLVCGSEDPLIRSYRDPNTLPVNYIRHNEAHFTTEVFEEYVRNWNSELEALNRKAILVLDRATIHSKLQLSNLKLVFVPWKTSGLVPIKNGIFGRFRAEFRKLLLEEIASNAIRGIYRDLTCLEALHMFEKAWERVPSQLILTTFQETGYDISKNEIQNDKEKFKVDNDNGDSINKIDDNSEAIANMLKDYNVEDYFTDVTLLDMYLTVDDDQLTGRGTNVSVFGGNHKGKRKIEPIAIEGSPADVLPLGTDKPECSDTEMYVRKTRALEDLEILRKYLQTSETPCDMYRNFIEIENFVNKTW